MKRVFRITVHDFTLYIVADHVAAWWRHPVTRSLDVVAGGKTFNFGQGDATRTLEAELNNHFFPTNS